jgi:hypothetical protein
MTSRIAGGNNAPKLAGDRTDAGRAIRGAEA